MIVASCRGYLDVVKYLISVGADFEAADNKKFHNVFFVMGELH